VPSPYYCGAGWQGTLYPPCILPYRYRDQQVPQSRGNCTRLTGVACAVVRDFEALGYVGDVTSVDVSILKTLVDSGVIPVVATVASDKHGNALNINADTVAGEIAAGLGASKLILMTGATLALPLLCGTHCGSSTRSTFQHNA
jgi:hypothetical protein